MPKYNTLIDAKPATVEITADGHVHVTTEQRAWLFNRNLEPEALKLIGRGNQVIYTFSSNKISRHVKTATDYETKEEEITTKDPGLASFGKALGAIQNVSKQANFPRAINNVISDAYKRIGQEPQIAI